MTIEAVGKDTIDLVIAYYNETDQLPIFLDYAKQYSYQVKLYNKGDDNLGVPLEIRKLPNRGGATHTYLYHIIMNYDNLADITLFTLGSGFRGGKKARKTHWLLQHASACRGFMSQHIWLSENDYDFELPVYEIFLYEKNKALKASSARHKTEMIRADTVPLGRWIEKHTGCHLTNRKFIRTNKDTFAVTREVIRNRPLSFWESLFKQVNEVGEGYNLEVIHYFERAWVCVFFERPRRDQLDWDKERYGEEIF